MSNGRVVSTHFPYLPVQIEVHSREADAEAFSIPVSMAMSPYRQTLSPMGGLMGTCGGLWLTARPFSLPTVRGPLLHPKAQQAS
jgi:hypothetical protein